MTVARSAVSRRGFLGLSTAGAAGAAGWLVGCGSSATSSAATTVRTCVYSRNHASSPLFWQQFAPEGYRVEVKTITSSAEIQTALQSGDLDFGLIGVYSTIIAGRGGTFSGKIISMCSRQGMGLIGRRGVVRQVADLRGRRVAVPPPGVQVLILNILLQRAGLSLDRDVEAVPLGYADHATALQRGDVDAYVGTEPQCTQSELAGVGQRLPGMFDTPIGDYNTAIWASPRILDQPDVVRAGAMMQRRAAEHLTPKGENDPAVWRDLLVRQFGYDEEVYRAVLDTIGAEWRFDERRVAQFEAAGQTMQRLGIIDRQPDYEAFYAREYWDV